MIIEKSVYQIVGSGLCIEVYDGKKVYDVIAKLLTQKKNVILSFMNVRVLTTSFLDSAIGLLYNDFSEEYIKKHLKIAELSPADIDLFKRVVENAKSFYKNPERLEQSVKEIIEEDKNEENLI